MGRGAGLTDAIQEPLLEAVAEIEVEVDAGLEIVARTVPWATYANYCSRLIADAGELRTFLCVIFFALACFPG